AGRGGYPEVEFGVRPKLRLLLALATHEDCAAILAAPTQPQHGGNSMSFNSYARRPRTLLAGGATLVAGAAVWLALAVTAASAAPVAGKADPNLYPFGAPSGGTAVKVPPPPTEP